AAVAFFCFLGDFAFIKIMTYEITYFHIISLIYNDYLINSCVGLQDLGNILKVTVNADRRQQLKFWQKVSSDLIAPNGNYSPTLPIFIELS
ncbi:MAG: hypothetical protein QX198_17115, partial [Methylococcaceae bacterium]